MHRPASSIHQELILHLDALGTALPHHAYFSGRQKADAMYSITLFVLLAATVVSDLAIGAPVHIFVLHVGLI